MNFLLGHFFFSLIIFCTTTRMRYYPRDIIISFMRELAAIKGSIANNYGTKTQSHRNLSGGRTSSSVRELRSMKFDWPFATTTAEFRRRATFAMHSDRSAPSNRGEISSVCVAIANRSRRHLLSAPWPNKRQEPTNEIRREIFLHFHYVAEPIIAITIVNN